jgi:hypothetical protein
LLHREKKDSRRERSKLGNPAVVAEGVGGLGQKQNDIKKYASLSIYFL